ncbi:alpha-1,2-fucosyltransferase [Rariglobus hedericola]|uniref:Alpha-1,2-fucosyltransferase n=1 Tax=Rariglobus hedericola TaxID=2597822 RepID=A0A556QPX6_9BACT|nr:alpha-1,2-fucosyltransferase [Rariglobus hedericola]TSJ78679.1 alpha-1,2-fucosyltransferase [Rariglobus hedericola]
MIRVLLEGQLGNNLFQIATALALAETHCTRIIIDVSRLPHMHTEFDARRVAALRFSFPRRVASVTLDKINLRLRGRHSHDLSRHVRHRETSPEFDPAVLTLGRDVILGGFFQDARYFASIAPKITSWFDLSPWLALADPLLRKLVASTNTIGIHVRRGDYLDPDKACFNVCGIAYYERAILRLRETTPDARLIIFSDDLDWCRTHFAKHAPLIADHRHEPYGMLVDLALLSSCQHQIIANSSFSWWAAWLNPNPARRVLMPDRWVIDETVPISTKSMRGCETVPVHD